MQQRFVIGSLGAFVAAIALAAPDAAALSGDVGRGQRDRRDDCTKTADDEPLLHGALRIGD